MSLPVAKCVKIDYRTYKVIAQLDIAFAVPQSQFNLYILVML